MAVRQHPALDGKTLFQPIAYGIEPTDLNSL
jgi:hypothetical protein